MNINLFSKELELKVNWKLSRNEAKFKKNFFIEVEEDGYKSIGEIAPNIRYGETEDLINQNFNFIQNEELTLSNLKSIYSKNEFCHSFKFGLESALIHLEAQKKQIKTSEYLKLKPVDSVQTSFSVPIMEINALEKYMQDLSRFPFIKIKVNSDNAIDFVTSISKLTSSALRVDGNEAWNDLDSYKKFEEKTKNLNIQFIEQPFKSTDIDSYISLKKNSFFEIMGDESIEDDADFELLSKQFHSINIKLMKTGGYFNAIRLLEEAKKHNLKTMIGCMIETSLGISSAMQIASLGDYFDLDGSLLLKNDPYNYIFEKEGSIFLR